MMEFRSSSALTFGMELELQIVSSETGALSPSSLAFWESVKDSRDAPRYSLEATLSTIELNTSVHTDADAMASEALRLTRTLCDLAASRSLLIRGGGTQRTQFWNERIMAPTERARLLKSRFGYLPKRFSTYGMHVHVGMPDGDEAIRVGNGLQACAPLFIALSAASPFLQMADTGFCASRPLEPLVYPHGGPMPRLPDWRTFEERAAEIFSTPLASSLNDVYWDVRPKPEFGTVEVRVFDTPLSVAKAVGLAAFTRAMAARLLAGGLALPATPPPPTAERVSRFLACRDGLEAELFDPFALRWKPARTWFEESVSAIERAPVCEADLRRILHLRRHLEVESDSTTMRRSWQAMVGGDDEGPDPGPDLARYSAELADRLLQPMSQTLLARPPLGA
ncbi:MAG: YbdK family carboxylate-amine ligase [Myxococcota bacterium]